jgi:Ca2+-dependent lipid-binding protein
LYRNTELFGQMDPFVAFWHKKKKYMTKVMQEAGKSPTWNDSFEIFNCTRQEVL